MGKLKGEPTPRSWTPHSLVPAESGRNREMSVSMKEEGDTVELPTS